MILRFISQRKGFVLGCIFVATFIYLIYTDVLSWSILDYNDNKLINFPFQTPDPINYEISDNPIPPGPELYSSLNSTTPSKDEQTQTTFTENIPVEEGKILSEPIETTATAEQSDETTTTTEAITTTTTEAITTTTTAAITTTEESFPTQSSDLGNKNPEEMSCHLPVLNPFDNSILEFVFTPEPVVCNNSRYPLIFVTDLTSSLLKIDDPSNYSLHSCCYRQFTRKEGVENAAQVSSICHPIETDRTQLSPDFEFIQIECQNASTNASGTNESNQTSIVIDMLGFTPLKPHVEKRLENINQKLEKELKLTENKTQNSNSNSSNEGNDSMSKGRRRVNVVVLGIDANSHMNFMRALPKSYNYLTNNLSGLGMWGYTKVGDNTFPNIVPILSGLFVEEMQKTCWKKSSDPFDACAFIWKNFSSQGYRTSYGEDAIWMGIFNYQKRGFAFSPTDYYLNTLTHQQDEHIGHEHLMNANICYGPRLGFYVMLDYLKKMAVAMNKDKRYFQFIWATSLFHDYLNQGKIGDEFLLETLQWFKNEGYLDDTAFILMSDHGIRWGDIRDTLQGKVEERMPFLYFIFPEWFQEQYRPAVSNVNVNKHRLTTPFDLHETFKDLLFLDNIKVDKIRERHLNLMETSSSNGSLPRGISLFLPIPLRRTCADAAIVDQWCVCRSAQSVNLVNNTIVGEAARSILHHINGMFVRHPQCSLLELKQILNAQVFQSANKEVSDVSAMINDSEDPRLDKQQVTFSVSIKAEPSNATFEAITTRHTDGNWIISGDISRTNLYGEQSRCVTDYNLKKFCYCKERWV